MREKLYELENLLGNQLPYSQFMNTARIWLRPIPIANFVGNPKIFALMNNTGCQTKEKKLLEKN